jgi:predicted DNA-binding protein (MmcQ/YjbR family)
MNIEKVRLHCLKKDFVTESFPFNEETLVFKAKDKIFCLANIVPPYSISLKCDPELAIELRERYGAVIPGYHLNKTHWNSIALDGSIADKEILNWIDHSYELIVNKLPQKARKTPAKKKPR